MIPHDQLKTVRIFSFEIDMAPIEDVRETYPFLEDRHGDYSELAPG